MRVWENVVVPRAVVIAVVWLMQTAAQSPLARGNAGNGVLGPVHTISMPGSGSRPLGFTTQIRIGDESAAGYIPVSITVAAIGTLPADRHLVYRFETREGGQTPPRRGLTVDVPIDVQQGTTTESFVRYLPKWSAGQAIDMSVMEDGRVLEDYTAFIARPVRRGKRSTRELLHIEQQINWVFLSSEDKLSRETMPDLSGLLTANCLAPNGSFTFGPIAEAEASTFWSQVTSGPDLMAIGQQDLPTDWRAYQRYDVIVTDTEGLGRLRASEPAFQAVRGWVLGGGTILIYDALSSDSVLAALNFRPTEDSKANEQRVWMQPVGAGKVMGIPSNGQYAVPPLAAWETAASTIGYRASPMLRRGVDPLIGDRRFSQWMIPGVAQPPVYTFMGLLTAFVVLVGPVAYRRTARVGRSYLMFAIAPFLALLTTVAMFGYGIVSDGFGTFVRARQLTWVDAKSGDAGERIRTTYFAGVRPSDGLRFPGNAEVIGYPEGMGKSWEELNEYSPATIGKVIIRDASQKFDSSFLPSRQSRQFVVHAPRPDVGYLQLIPDPQGSSTPMVENGFDFVLHEAVLRDSRGDYWTVENVAAGEQRPCRKLSLKESSRELGRIYNDHRPLSTVRESRAKKSYTNEVYDVILDGNRQLKTGHSVTDGIFEDWLQRHLQTLGEIPNEHFIATADVSADVLAVEGSELAASVRYVFGTFR